MTASIPKMSALGTFGYLKVKETLVDLRKGVGRILPWTVEHALFVGGLAGMAYGASMIYRPLGPIIGGWFAVKVAMLIASERR